MRAHGDGAPDEDQLFLLRRRVLCSLPADLPLELSPPSGLPLFPVSAAFAPCSLSLKWSHLGDDGQHAQERLGCLPSASGVLAQKKASLERQSASLHLKEKRRNMKCYSLNKNSKCGTSPCRLVLSRKSATPSFPYLKVFSVRQRNLLLACEGRERLRRETETLDEQKEQKRSPKSAGRTREETKVPPRRPPTHQREKRQRQRTKESGRRNDAPT
ncbi:hypothetical protein TGDOM2_398370, partial [Toxoplasma gondii GAB2-2007-GAL-DOM2]